MTTFEFVMTLHPEDGGNMFVPKVGNHLQDHTVVDINVVSEVYAATRHEDVWRVGGITQLFLDLDIGCS